MAYIIVTMCVMIALFTLAVTVRIVLAQKRISWLVPSPPSMQAYPKLSVIIPARDEEQDIAASLHSVLNQQGVDLRVIMVNDHSTDRTGQIVEEIAQSDSRVTVLHNPPMQSMWLGKVNAMQYSAARADGTYLLFTDAEILHAPLCFASAIKLMQQNAYDFFSFSPLWINECVWEHMNVPIYFAAFIKFLPLSGLDDPASPKALASGAFLLMKTTVFQETGGFESVKGEMLDDVGRARALKARQYRVRFWFAPECSQVRLFKNAHDAFWDTTKNILAAVEGHSELAIPLILAGILQY